MLAVPGLRLLTANANHNKISSKLSGNSGASKINVEFVGCGKPTFKVINEQHSQHLAARLKLKEQIISCARIAINHGEREQGRLDYR